MTKKHNHTRGCNIPRSTNLAKLAFEKAFVWALLTLFTLTFVLFFMPTRRASATDENPDDPISLDVEPGDNGRSRTPALRKRDET